MKSPRRTRRLKDESCVRRVATAAGELANTSDGICATSIASQDNHRRCYHCPSRGCSNGASSHEDGDPSVAVFAMSSTCLACERLHGSCETRRSVLERRTRSNRYEFGREHFPSGSRRSSFDLPERGGPKTSTTKMTTRTKTFGMTRTRTRTGRDETRHRNSRNARYASSVVRWRQLSDWKIAFNVVLFLNLVFQSNGLGALETSVKTPEGGGEAGGGSHGGNDAMGPVVAPTRLANRISGN